jgi:hypothetical protein
VLPFARVLEASVLPGSVYFLGRNSQFTQEEEI